MIVSLGDLSLDILVKAEAGAKAHRSASPGSVKMTSGGLAANFAVWASRLGWNSRFVGKVGTDPAADLLVIDLLKEGVVAETVTEEGSTATLVRMQQRHGPASLTPDRGVASRLRPEELRLSWFSDAQWLHLPAWPLLEMPIATAATRAIRMARQSGARVSIDLSSAAELRKYGVAKVAVLLKTIAPNVVFANQEEAMLFASGALGEIADVVVLTLGAEGCAVADEHGYQEFKGEKVRLVDATGAGEAFTAAWCVTYLASNSAEKACRLANGLAARVVSAEGARPTVSLAGLLVR